MIDQEFIWDYVNSKYVKGNILSLFKEQKLKEMDNSRENLYFLYSLVENKLVQPLEKAEFSKYKLWCYFLILLLFFLIGLLEYLSMSQKGIFKKVSYRI